MTIVERLERWSKDRPDATAYLFLRRGEENGRLTFRELRDRAAGIARYLIERGCSSRPVALAFDSNRDFLCAFFGCLWAGAIAVPCCPPRSPRSKIYFQSILRDCGAELVLTSLEMIPPAEGGAPRPSLNDLAMLQYTSGSTGNPKGVMLTHRSIVANERVIEEAFGHDSETVVVGWLPLFHDMGLIGNALQPLHLGRPCVLLSPLEVVQKPFRWLEAIAKYRATTSGAPGFAYAWSADRIAEEDRKRLDLSSWKLAYVGSEPVYADVLDRFAERFAPCGFRAEALYPCYGLAESTLFVTGILHGTPWRRLAVGDKTQVGLGYPRRDHRVEIVDPETFRRADRGEIWVAGPSVARGYWKRPGETLETFGAFLTDTGEGPFLRTGDLGFRRDGELFVTGRIKDVIILRGVKHHSEDLEYTVERAHPALRSHRGAAFALDGAGAERLAIVQEVDASAEGLDEIAAEVRAAITARHEIVVDALAFVPVGSLPRTTSGKIRRAECRREFSEGKLR